MPSSFKPTFDVLLNSMTFSSDKCSLFEQHVLVNIIRTLPEINSDSDNWATKFGNSQGHVRSIIYIPSLQIVSTVYALPPCLSELFNTFIQGKTSKCRCSLSPNQPPVQTNLSILHICTESHMRNASSSRAL
jgi:hypothetical protein